MRGRMGALAWGVVIALRCTMGCNAILGWEQSWTAGPAPSCEGAGTDSCNGQLTDCCDSLAVAGCNGGCGGGVINGFCLDAYEVTVARYRPFLAAKGKQTDFRNCAGATYAASGHDDLPINCVTFEEARAFCEWDKARLPTLQEFKRAAMELGTDPVKDPSWPFPWGMEAPTNDYATIATNSPQPVGSASLGKGGFGQYDLLGNVQEWATESMVYGRSFDDDWSDINTASFRSTAPPPPLMGETMSRHSTIGFRCARDL